MPAKRKKRFARWCAAGLVVVAIGVGVVESLDSWIPKTFGDPQVHVAKETTYLTKPLRKDGTVDYAAALNSKAKRGITPEKNAVAEIVQVCSREHLSDAALKTYYRELGIKQVKKPRKRLLSISEFCRKVKRRKDYEYESQLRKDFSKAFDGPWSPKDHSNLAAWIKGNSEPLQTIEKAVRRPRWYWPIVSNNGKVNLLDETFSDATNMHDVVQSFVALALLAAHENRNDDAVRHLMTTFQLAVGLRQGFWRTDRIVAMAADAMAGEALVKILQTGKLTSKQLESLAGKLAKLPSPSQNASQSRLTARCFTLEVAARIAVKGLDGLDGATTFDYRKTVPHGNGKVIDKYSGKINWDIPLKMINAYFDDYETAMRKPSYAEQMRACRKLEARRLKSRDTIWDEKLPWKLRSGMRIDSKKISNAMGIVLVWLPNPAQPTLECPFEARQEARLRLTKLAVALARYHVVNGRFPEKPDDLRPKFIKELPADPFVEKPFRYQRTKHGYRLHSIGPNMKDDDGKFGGDADDLVVRMKLAK